jgi:hypothetical protein
VTEKTVRPLRCTVERWLAVANAFSARIKRGSRAGSNHAPSVCIEASISTDAFSIYLFRQGDGTWCVLPPDDERPAMRINQICSPDGILAELTDHRSPPSHASQENFKETPSRPCSRTSVTHPKPPAPPSSSPPTIAVSSQEANCSSTAVQHRSDENWHEALLPGKATPPISDQRVMVLIH